MISTVAAVVRGEGLASALRRVGERLSEASSVAALRAAGLVPGGTRAALLNVVAAGAAPRLGGVQQQLAARLDRERELRDVALLSPGLLDLSSRGRRSARGVSRDLAIAIRDALALTGAKAVHFEGTAGVPLPLIRELAGSGVAVVVGVHDFSLFCARPHLLEEPSGEFCGFSADYDRCHRCLEKSWIVEAGEQARRREAARETLQSATALIFPSRYMLERHREIFSLPRLDGAVIAPATPAPRPSIDSRDAGRSIAFAGSVKRHKGGQLLPEIARIADIEEMHVFGGGDEGLLRELRGRGAMRLHGYYRSGELPALLRRHGAGLVVLPSIVPESYGLTISESWQAGAAVVAFDLGAQGERIRELGGGWLAPPGSGAAGIAAIVARWKAGELTTPIPRSPATPLDAARAHVELYREAGLLADG